MIQPDGLQKNYLLGNNPWVQSPLCIEVKKLLDELKTSYYQRGTGKATKELNDVIEKHRSWVSSIIDLSEFPFAYVTPGATGAIEHWRLTDTRPWQYFTGDYQYPQMLSNNGIEVDSVQKDKVLYISNPQCYNGNFIELDYITNPVILDCAYVGATKNFKIIAPANTEQVMFSFSKGWGLIGQRCGLVYTKKPHKSLHPLKKVECFNYSSALIINTIIDNFTIDEMYNRYKNRQKQICDLYDLKPSDTYFIATTENPSYKKFRRKKKTARVCLTPLLEKTYS